ncbi:MAG: hypothetical protein MI923_11255 [Phycisphaerales bacterium]|nr:hypothetical protein [Phycisphaerales bacterium]
MPTTAKPSVARLRRDAGHGRADRIHGHDRPHSTLTLAASALQALPARGGGSAFGPEKALVSRGRNLNAPSPRDRGRQTPSPLLDDFQSNRSSSSRPGRGQPPAGCPPSPSRDLCSGERPCAARKKERK